jgi:hypothetical protein
LEKIIFSSAELITQVSLLSPGKEKRHGKQNRSRKRKADPPVLLFPLGGWGNHISSPRV